MTVREHLHQLMNETLVDERAHHNWWYRAVRPMPVPPAYRGQHITGDCSKGVQYLCRWAGAPDPMGNNWSSYGNSSTLAAHLRHVSHPSQLSIGDIVTFGAGGRDHAAMVKEPGNDPLLWSFGHQGAPNSYHLSWDHRERQFLKIWLPDVPDTPQERLRAQKGYWAWLQWKLGEGDWRKYKPAVPAVRPNVPKRIPMSWWREYAKFLAARNRANAATTSPFRED